MPDITKKTWKIGTRGSELALAQVALLRHVLIEQFPGIHTETVVVATTGDVRQDLPLGTPTSGADKGVFTRELESELLAGNLDLVVHSLKDVPTKIPDGLKIAGTLKRAPVEDVLISQSPIPDGLESLAPGTVVATSSVRRRFQVLRQCPHCEIRPIRGNVPTRLGKLADGVDGISALLLARAGLERLGWAPADGNITYQDTPLFTSILPAKSLLPAAAQGAIGLQIRTSDEQAATMVESVTDPATWQRVRCEREFLRLLNAGCHTPIGIHTEIENAETLHAEALLFSEDGQHLQSSSGSGTTENPEALARILFDGLTAETL